MTNEEAISVIENEIQIDVRLCTDEQVDKFQTALYMAISALRAEPTGDSLTLEQLREMDGKPVWVKCLNSKKYISPPVGWRILEKSITGRIGVWDGENCLIERNYGTDWLAYTYPPAHIDREAWEPCGAYVPKIVTNADRIRAMSDEELAEWMCSLMTAECCDQRCPARDICNLGDNGLVKWMKQPAEEAQP